MSTTIAKPEQPRLALYQAMFAWQTLRDQPLTSHVCPEGNFVRHQIEWERATSRQRGLAHNAALRAHLRAGLTAATAMGLLQLTIEPPDAEVIGYRLCWQRVSR